MHHLPRVPSPCGKRPKIELFEEFKSACMPPRPASASLAEPSFAELFTPKLVTVFREGYGWPDLRADAVSGLTVAVVALPLSMAIAIASGFSPERGLYTAIAGGLIISLIGGSRFQIGGPAGAFIGLIAGVVERHGYDGLALATVVAGLILIAVGLLRAGTYIKYIPFPVTVGFTAGIAVIIAASQIRDVLGLTIAHEPSALLPKLSAIRDALPSAHLPTVAIAVMSGGSDRSTATAAPELAIFPDCGVDRGSRLRCLSPRCCHGALSFRDDPTFAADSKFTALQP